MDGHMGIATSNHSDIPTIATSLRSSLCANYEIEGTLNAVNEMIRDAPLNPAVKKLSEIISNNACPVDSYQNESKVQLSVNKNIQGFAQRKAEGRKAGTNFVRLIKDYVTNMDTVDIVCHSMGFAYAQGVIEALKESRLNIGLGGYYIIAPENACSGKVDVNDWQQIWQYGTNENNTKKWLQDGVAPQCRIENLYDNPPKSGRAYIPDNAPKGFIESHTINNYGWIFNDITNPLAPGYVTPRK